MITWQPFALLDIFSFERGDRLITVDQVSGETAYISSSGKDNGIASYVTPPAFMKVHRNKLTIANSGTVGVVFYHPYEFVASDHCTVLTLVDESVTLDEDLFLFLRPVLESIRYRYNFGREINTRRLSREVLSLPADSSGVPSWSYMREYIQRIRKPLSFSPIERSAPEPVTFDVGTWSEFRIGDVFQDIKAGKCGSAQNLLVDGNDMPYIGAKRNDFGVVRQVATPESAELVFSGPAFAFICDGQGSVGLTTYVPFSRFVGTTTVKFGYLPELDLEVATFMSTIIDMNRPRFSFGRKWGARLEDTVIALPTAVDGRPDFEFMRQYIKNLDYGDLLAQV